MPNYFPYLMLTLLSLAFLIGVVIERKQAGYAALFISFSGMVYFAEFFVLVLGDGYTYYPKILPQPYYDNILGSIPSNLFIIPSLALLSAVYRPRLRWLVLWTLGLVAIEFLFESLGIYVTRWWRKEYTLAAMLFFFPFAQFWLSSLRSGRGWTRFLSLWMMAWSSAATVMYIMSVLGIRYYDSGIYEEPYKDDIFISAVIGFVKGLVFTLLTLRSQKIGIRLLAPLLVFAADLPLYGLGILVIQIPFWIYALIYLSVAALLMGWVVYACSFFTGLKDRRSP